MFTGIIEEVGNVLEASDGVLRIEVHEIVDDSKLGDSIAINGCCLTVVEIGVATLWFEAGPETLACTNLGELVPGAPVNLERPLAAGGRLGGHFVQGHVDVTNYEFTLTDP